MANHGDHEIQVIGRLAAGVSLRTAQSELNAISNNLAQQYPETNQGVRAVLARLQEDIVRNVRTALLVLLAATGLIVLIACVNVANLLLVRSMARRHETSVRLALGASRSRIVGQFLVESLLVALGGCGAGMLLGVLITRLMLSMAPASIPRMDSVHIDWLVFSVSTIIAVATGIIFGIVPAWQASRATRRVLEIYRKNWRGHVTAPLARLIDDCGDFALDDSAGRSGVTGTELRDCSGGGSWVST